MTYQTVISKTLEALLLRYGTFAKIPLREVKADSDIFRSIKAKEVVFNPQFTNSENVDFERYYFVDIPILDQLHLENLEAKFQASALFESFYKQPQVAPPM